MCKKEQRETHTDNVKCCTYRSSQREAREKGSTVSTADIESMEERMHFLSIIFFLVVTVYILSPAILLFFSLLSLPS